MARRVKGGASLRRLLRKLEPELNAYLRGELQSITGRLVGRAKAEVPVRTGALRNALRGTVTPKTLVAKIGLVTKATRRRFFYGFILDQGRKHTIIPLPNGKQRVIPAISRERYNFVFGRRRDFINEGLPRLRTVLERVLRRVAAGSGND